MNEATLHWKLEPRIAKTKQEKEVKKGSMEEIVRTVYEGVDFGELSDNEQQALNELVYVRTFSAIASNDPTVTAFHPVDLQLQPTYDHVQRLAAALTQNNNNHIQWIQLQLDNSLCYHDDQPLVVSLIHYLRESAVLRRVDIQLEEEDALDGMVYEHFQSMIQALTDSLSLKTLKLGIVCSPTLDDDMALDVAGLIQTTTSLQELDMAWTDDHNIATAVVSNRTIKVLRLHIGWLDDNDIRGHLLSNYVAQSSLPSLLTELSVDFHRHRMNLPELDRALSMFLKSAAPSLQKLTVQSMAFDDERMKLFLDAIRYHETLHKLELKFCIFNDAAIQSFIKFWQNDDTVTSNESGDNDASVPRQQPYNIKSLYICGDVRSDRPHVLAASDTTNMANVLALSLQEYCSLEHLHWSLRDGSAQFWNMISDNASKTQLTSLRLDCGYETMLRCLPKMQHLRVFQCKPFELDEKKHIPEHLLLNMVRANGSLLRFPDDDDDNDNEENRISIWDRHPAVKPRIHAYFQRNEGLSKLLACSCIEAAASHDDDAGDRPAQRAKKEHPVEDSIHLTPLLFAAAQPLIALAPNYILIGLLKLVDPSGPTFKNEIAEKEV